MRFIGNRFFRPYIQNRLYPKEVAMSQKIVTTLTLFILTLLILIGLWALSAYSTNLTNQVSQNRSSRLDQSHNGFGIQAALPLVIYYSQVTSRLPGSSNWIAQNPIDGSRAVLLLSQGSRSLNSIIALS